MIPECHDTRFCSERVQHLVLFNGKNAHSGNCLWRTFRPECAILGESDFDIGALGFDAGLFLAKAGHPRFTVGMRRVQGREERAWAFAFKIDCADVGRSKRTTGGQEGRGLMAGNKDAFHAKVLPRREEVGKGNPPIFELLVNV